MKKSGSDAKLGFLGKPGFCRLWLWFLCAKASMWFRAWVPPPPPCASTAAVPKVRSKRRFNTHPVLRQGRECAIVGGGGGSVQGCWFGMLGTQCCCTMVRVKHCVALSSPTCSASCSHRFRLMVSWAVGLSPFRFLLGSHEMRAVSFGAPVDAVKCVRHRGDTGRFVLGSDPLYGCEVEEPHNGMEMVPLLGEGINQRVESQ